MTRLPPHFEPMRSETFPYPERYAHGVSPLGPLSYFDTGTATETPPIVLVHALGLNFTEWEHVIPPLEKRTRVIGLDLPGCGHSAKPRHRYSLELMTQAVLGLLDFLRIDKAILVGHSYGGRVVTELALGRPDRVAGLCLMNSSGFNTYPKLLHCLAPWVFRPIFVAPLFTQSVEFILANIFTTENRHTEAFKRQILERRETRYAWDFARYASPMIGDIMSNVLDRIEELTLPILVIWGDRDALLRYKDVTSWVRRLRDASLVTISRCGHMPNLEYPEQVSAAILKFLDRFADQRQQLRMQAGPIS